MTFSLPVVTYTPASCLTLTWKVYRASDNANMETLMPSTFSITSELTITHYESNYSIRKSLYGEDNYYFKGYLDDLTLKETSDFAFAINF